MHDYTKKKFETAFYSCVKFETTISWNKANYVDRELFCIKKWKI